MRTPDPVESRRATAGLSAGVSAIIPAYNYAQYLERAVRSALSQSHRPLEVIIVDDGSTDSTPGLGERLALENPEVRYLRQANAGLSAARNAGIRAAQYPFIAFLDADDEWLEGFLASAMDAFRQKPEIGLFGCNSFRANSNGDAIGEKRTAPRGDRFFSAADILMKTRFMPSCAVARKACFESAGEFDTTLRSSEDRDMWLRIAVRHPVFYRDRALVRIRKHGGNMSRNTVRMRAAMRQVRRKAMRARVVPFTDFGFWLRALAVDHFQAGWMYHDEGRRLRAILHSAASLLLWPLPLDSTDLHEPALFRLRAALRFILLGGPPEQPVP